MQIPCLQLRPALQNPPLRTPMSFSWPTIRPPKTRTRPTSYYTATQVLLYQLLHAPSTGTQASIPVVILATESVKAAHIDRLRASGADVRVVDRIKAAPWTGDIEEPRWRDILTKLRAFELYEFEKVLLLDSDMLLVDRLDDIFSDPATDLLVPNSTLARPDEGPLPSRYMISAQIITNDTTHSYPPVGAPYFSAGFFLCHPNAEVVGYYQSLMQVRDRFETGLAEQDSSTMRTGRRGQCLGRISTIDGRRRGRVL